MSSKLFVFNRNLPVPFDKVGTKKVKVSSKYGDGTEATLSTTVVKGVLAYCTCRDGSKAGAVGACGQKGVAEYKSSTGPDDYHLAVYDPTTGSVLASAYNKDTEMMETYTVGKNDRDGAALLMAMLPALMADQEFSETLDAFEAEYQGGYYDVKKATELMAVLCDNAYRRVNDDTCPAHLKVTIENSGNVMRVSQTHLDAGKFVPDSVIAGEFTILAHTGVAPIIQTGEAIPHTDFVGKYSLDPSRVLTPAEQVLVPTLEPWYILPEEVVSICRHASLSTGKSKPMRNFLLRGPSSTGKTEGARAIAAGLGLPYVIYTCSSNTEVFDFVGQVFPETDGPSTGDADLDRERQELKEMGGITYENVKKLMGLPDLDDMDYDPVGTYMALSGISKIGATTQDCMALVMELVTDKLQKLCTVKPKATAGQTYTYVETDFIRAMKYGYVCEIQEPTVITQPGVLVGLNSLLEQSGLIRLPTGEVIRRHPDAVVVITTNISYEGCRGINQSVLDRMNLTQDICLPTPEVMAQRAMSVTGCEDDYMVSRMVQVVNDLDDYCRKNGITDGSCGMRSLFDWIMSAEITGDPYASALSTIISKATADEEDREALITSVLEPIFAPKRKKAV